MKLIASTFLRSGAKKLHKLDRLIRKHPKKSLAIAGGSLIGANLGLAAYGHKKYKKKRT